MMKRAKRSAAVEKTRRSKTEFFRAPQEGEPQVRFPINLIKTKKEVMPKGTTSLLERVMGIEPTQPAWKAGILAVELHPHLEQK